MMKGKSKENQTSLAKKEPSHLVAPNEEVIGQENIESQDIIIPRIRLFQPISTEVVENTAKAGTLRNSLTNEDSSELEVLIFYFFKSRVLFNRSMPGHSGDKGIACMSTDGKRSLDHKKCDECGASMWETISTEQRKEGKKPTGPECDTVYNFPCLIVNSKNQDIPVSLSLRRTSANQAKQLISLVKLSRMQWWSMVFSVKSKLNKGDKGSFYTFEVKAKRKATDEEVQKARIYYDGIIGRNIKVEEDQKDDYRHE